MENSVEKSDKRVENSILKLITKIKSQNTHILNTSNSFISNATRTYFVSFFIYVCRGGDWGVEM